MLVKVALGDNPLPEPMLTRMSYGLLPVISVLSQVTYEMCEVYMLRFGVNAADGIQDLAAVRDGRACLSCQLILLVIEFIMTYK